MVKLRQKNRAHSVSHVLGIRWESPIMHADTLVYPRQRRTCSGAAKDAGEYALMAELDEMIARGWGGTPRQRIPANWRDKFGPDRISHAAVIHRGAR